MVLQLVLRFVFKEDKLKTTPVAVKRLIHLKQRQAGPAVTDGRSPEGAGIRLARTSLGARQPRLPGGAAGAAGSSQGSCSPSGRRHTAGSASLCGSWRSVGGRPSRRRSERNTPAKHTCVRRPGGAGGAGAPWGGLWSHSPGTRTAFLLVCGWTSCDSERRAQSQTPTHKFDT